MAISTLAITTGAAPHAMSGEGEDSTVGQITSVPSQSSGNTSPQTTCAMPADSVWDLKSVETAGNVLTLISDASTLNNTVVYRLAGALNIQKLSKVVEAVARTPRVTQN
ncbi:hypothetical protein PspLS_10471 [Pyricularia sp. CBS 133598]|nr:hypothetical protein PspLS_10471 [Pyricularia sp. CBS 133598]